MLCFICLCADLLLLPLMRWFSTTSPKTPAPTAGKKTEKEWWNIKEKMTHQPSFQSTSICLMLYATLKRQVVVVSTATNFLSPKYSVGNTTTLGGSNMCSENVNQTMQVLFWTNLCTTNNFEDCLFLLIMIINKPDLANSACICFLFCISKFSLRILRSGLHHGGKKCKSTSFDLQEQVSLILFWL